MAVRTKAEHQGLSEFYQPIVNRSKTMSAFIVVDLTPTDAEKAQQYGAAAAATIAQYDGEFVVKGAIEPLNGGSQYQTKAIIRFPDRAVALDWYQSDEYQALVPLRDEAMDSIFHLVG
jgi:uncharacterized protein (DUF1330 family)